MFQGGFAFYMNNISYKRPLDNEDKMSSKRRVINLVSLFFLLSSTSKSLLLCLT